MLSNEGNSDMFGFVGSMLIAGAVGSSSFLTGTAPPFIGSSSSSELLELASEP